MSKFKIQSGWVQSLILFLISLILFCLVAGIIVFAWFAKDLPDPQQISHIQLVQSTKIYDRTEDVLLYDVHGEEKRTIIEFNQISDHIKNATIVTEDANFYQHHGIHFKAILRAIWANLKNKSFSQGFSTISQQVIKNSLLTPEKTLTRKLKEIILSLELERKYSKDEILSFYLNQVSYGSNAYGIEAASQTFFGKSAKDINLAEAAILAGLPKAPSYYSPYGLHPEDLKARQEYVLDRLAQFGYISQDEALAAKKEKLNFMPPGQEIKAPHFVMYIKEYLESRYGQKQVEQSGLKVITTLDYQSQQLAEDLLRQQAEKNLKTSKARNMALVALDPKTGQILTMVGSKDYFDVKNDGNVNVALRDRQPGSAFKPIAYATAFKKGFGPDTVVFDVSTEFATGSSPSYRPQNYTGKSYGPVSLRSALAMSLNIPAVKTLYLAGLNETINTAQDLGISTLKDRSRFGLSLVLGGGELKLLELTAAYGVFADEGVLHPTNFILKVEDYQGNVLEEYRDQPRRVLPEQITRQITDILSDNAARSPMFGANSYLYLGDIPAAAKTGTTQDFRDGWALGYTPSLVVGVWAGNNDNSPMAQDPGGRTAGPLWHDFMLAMLKDKPKEEFTKPESATTDKPMLNGQYNNNYILKIDKISGKLASDLTPPEYIMEKIFSQIHCILYYIDKNDPLGPIPQTPWQDPQFINWETAVQDWLTSPAAQARGLSPNTSLPSEYDDIHTLENQPQIEILSPQENETVKSKISVNLRATAPFFIKQVDLFFDSTLIYSTSQGNLNFSWSIPASAMPGEHFLRVQAYDQVGNQAQKEISVFIENASASKIINSADSISQTPNSQTSDFAIPENKKSKPPKPPGRGFSKKN